MIIAAHDRALLLAKYAAANRSKRKVTEKNYYEGPEFSDDEAYSEGSGEESDEEYNEGSGEESVWRGIWR